MHSGLRLVLARLEAMNLRPRRQGDGWIVFCPVHENPPDKHRPSLSVRLAEDSQKVLLRCFAGCSAEAILRALGLEWKDLQDGWQDWPPSQKPAKTSAVAPSESGNGDHHGDHQRSAGGPTGQRSYPSAAEALAAYGNRRGWGKPNHIWTYTLADGSPCFAVGRWDSPPGASGKQFAQVSRQAEGVWALKNTLDRLPLYNLPEIVNADPDVPIVVCEGEKATEAARQCGLLATCSAGGANAAAKTDWSSLAGRKVIVLPDNDNPGQKYAETVARLALEAGAAEVKILRLADFCPGMPEGGDIADVLDSPDWCGCGLREEANPEDLGRWILDQAERLPSWRPEPAPEAGPVIVRLSEVEPQEIQWLWAGRIPLGRISLLVGMPGSGKSLLTLDMAARITRGWNWPDKAPCTKGNALFVVGEDGLADTVRGRAEAAGADVNRIFVLTGIQRVDKDQPFQVPVCLAHIEEITKAVMQTQPRLVVFDPIGHFIPADIDTNTENHVRLVLGRIAELAEQYRTAVLLVAHRRKARAEFADDVVLGSRAFVGLARAVWHVCRDAEDQNRRLLVPGKNNLAPPMEGLAFWIKGGLDTHPCLEWEADPVPMTASQALAREYEAVRGGSVEEAKKALILALSNGPRPAKELMAALRDQGLAERTVYRAKAALGIKSKKQGYQQEYVWYLDEAGEYPAV